MMSERERSCAREVRPSSRGQALIERSGPHHRLEAMLLPPARCQH